MDSGRIILNELKKDIQYIELYGKEEEDYLGKIYGCFNELNKYYVSSNNSLLNDKQIELNRNINTIISNRIKYIDLLKNTIITYISTAKKTSENFDREG